MDPTPRAPNPRRVAAGRRNQSKRKGFSPQGLEALREAALRHQPWRFSTGPRTPAGKARVVQNGKRRQLAARSVREIRRDMAALRSLLAGFQDNLPNTSPDKMLKILTSPCPREALFPAASSSHGFL